MDTTNLEQFGFDDIPEDNFVITTWHENETLEDVIEFASGLTDFSPTTC